MVIWGGWGIKMSSVCAEGAVLEEVAMAVDCIKMFGVGAKRCFILVFFKFSSVLFGFPMTRELDFA